jgi:hypothetical protein
MRDGRAVRALTPEMIGVVYANVRQVAAIRERLPLACAAILVETANRFQGLERAVMLVYHPLSGWPDADQFHLDAGRLCVALSRHRVAGFLFARAGIADQLRHYAPRGARILETAADPEFAGWSAHLAIMQALRAQGRIIPLR